MPVYLWVVVYRGRFVRLSILSICQPTSVLARKLFASMCVRLRQCCHFHITSGSELAVKQSLSTKGVRLVSHPQWSVLVGAL
jgi:hypothetical protein